MLVGVQTHCKGKNYKHVRVISDNITAVSYVNNKGGVKSEFSNKIAKRAVGVVYITKYGGISCTHSWNTKYGGRQFF